MDRFLLNNNKGGVDEESMPSTSHGSVVNNENIGSMMIVIWSLMSTKINGKEKSTIVVIVYESFCSRMDVAE